MSLRPIWEGHLRLSLVSCPVALYGAVTRESDVSFRLINPATGNRIRQVTLDAETGEELERRDLARGFEIEKDRYVLLSDEEIRAVRLESTGTLDIERFVDVREIDRIWWDTPYYMAPDGKAGTEAFAVIREALRGAGRVALGRVVMHMRERLVAVEPRGKGLLVTTLRSHDEIRDEAAVLGELPSGKADPKMVAIAEQIIAQQEGPFDPTQFVDRYEDALRALIRAKQDGGDGGTPAAPPRQDNVVDLMEALRRSLAGRTPAKVPAKTAAKPAAKKPADKKTAAKRADPKPTVRKKAATTKRSRAG